MTVTSVEILWAMPPPVAPLPRRPMATPLPAMHELTDIARAIAAEPVFHTAARRLEHAARQLTRSTDALCVAFNWPRRSAYTAQGPILDDSVRDLIAQVAGSGKWSLVANALMLPIGCAPARAVLALRRPEPYQLSEVGLMSALCGGIAPTLERLISRP